MTDITQAKTVAGAVRALVAGKLVDVSNLSVEEQEEVQKQYREKIAESGRRSAVASKA